jgi:two-component system osmolarity sensor histidine kinase EnvZ
MWLKRMMPKGLYGRGALILLVPIVTLQLVVSILFIQRHFEGVTEQMTRNMLTGVHYLLDAMNDAPTPEAAAAAAEALRVPLAITGALVAGDVPATDVRRIYDLSGRAIIATLRAGVPGVLSVDLVENRREVRMVVTSVHGPLRVVIDRFRVSASNPHQLLVIVLFTGFLMTVIAFLFLRNQLRSILRLARAAEAFGRGQALDYTPSGASEVRAAGSAFLDMRARIERQAEQRTLMLSGVSHDLRTPLTRLRLGLSMLPEGDETAALARDVDEMEHLIDTFLAYARGSAPEAAVPCDPVALVADVIDKARRAGQEVTLGAADTAGETPVLYAALLARAVENLVGNAVRYAGAAEVSVSCSAGRLRILVEDAGPGIPADRREEAMRPFTRLDRARNQNSGGGVGLGLAIARDAVRRSGGELRLDDSPRLGGLRAEIVIPLSGAPVAAAPAVSGVAPGGATTGGPQ